MTALSATVGTGILPALQPIAIGGPGALFWMWVTGLVGMATKYSEAILAVKYRKRMPMAPGRRTDVLHQQGVALQRAKTLGVLLPFCCGERFGIGNMVQSNSVAHALKAVSASQTGLQGSY